MSKFKIKLARIEAVGRAERDSQVCITFQVNREQPHMHHDALELPDGHTILLTFLCEGQEATVLQLPAKPATNEDADAQTRALYVG
jgi:hypothetical protein